MLCRSFGLSQPTACTLFYLRYRLHVFNTGVVLSDFVVLIFFDYSLILRETDISERGSIEISHIIIIIRRIFLYYSVKARRSGSKKNNVKQVFINLYIRESSHHEQ